jgi:YrbI family 3-deoxy-D-manno-octulosonate 8-phosphate phosphatase
LDRVVNSEHILAVVPARGGSKSIPRKNIRPFAGHPLLAYSIAAGLQSDTVTRVIVSTEDDEIAEVARSYGADVPFMRSIELAQDDTPDYPVFEQLLSTLASKEGYEPDIVVQLRPTSPIRPPDCVDQAVQMLREDDTADSVRGVVPARQNPYKMWRIQDDGLMSPLIGAEIAEAHNMPRQALPASYWQTGHIDVIRASTILAKRSMSGSRIRPYLLEPGYSVDIDTEADWLEAEKTVLEGRLDTVWPGGRPRSFPEEVELVVLDFDGVMTDDRVWVNEKGQELVAANRGDGWGLARLKDAGVRLHVLSTEPNPVVAARAEKLGIPVTQGVSDKGIAIRQLIEAEAIDASSVVFVGNDANDLPAFPYVGYAVVVSDAHPSIVRAADRVLTKPGGHGAVRELCDIILTRMEKE